MLKTPLHLRETGRPGSGPLWILAMRPSDELHVGGKVVTADVNFLKSVASETRRALYLYETYAPKDSKPFRMPVLLEHARKGGRYGDILDLKLSGEGDRFGLYVKVLPQDDVRLSIDSGRIQFVSVGISGSYTDENGEVYSPYMSEISLVASPHLKSIGSIQDTLHLTLSESAQAELNNLTEAETMELKDMIEAMLVRLDALEAKLDEDGELPEADLEDEDGEESEPVEASEDTPEPLEASEDVDTADTDVEDVPEPVELAEDVEETPEAVEVPTLLTLSEDALKALISDAVAAAMPGRPLPPQRLAKGSDKPSPPQRLELSEWIAKTAKERGVSKSEAARLSMTEFNT